MQMGPLEMSGHWNRTLAFREKKIITQLQTKFSNWFLFLLLWPCHSQI